MVRGCHILEASDSERTEHVAVTPDQGIDLGASEDEESAKSVVEAVARAITNYGRRCRAEHLPDHDGWASDLRARCAETLNVNDRSRGDGADGDYVLLDETPCVRRHDVDSEVAQRLLGSLVKAESSSCLLYTSPSPRDATLSRMPSSA